MSTKDVGMAGLRGWRNSVANAVASPVAKRSSLQEDQIRAAIGAVFLVLSIVYVLGALKDAMRSES